MSGFASPTPRDERCPEVEEIAENDAPFPGTVSVGETFAS